MALGLPNSVFYHIPKTGGIWVQTAIRRAGVPARVLGNSPVLQENLHNDYRKVSPNGKFSFAFVRHPLAWYRSFWSYRMQSGWKMESALDHCMALEFDRFIRKVLRSFPRGFLETSYERYVGPEPGVLDFVGRTENLTEDLVKALRLAGEIFDEEKLRTTPPQNEGRLRPLYPGRLREAVLKAEERTLKRFGYEEDGSRF